MLEIRLAAGSVPTEALTQHLLCLFLTSGRCQPPSLFRVPWLVYMSLQCLPLSPHGLLPCASVSVSIPHRKTPIIEFGPP